MSKVVFSGCSFTAGTGWNKDNINADCKDYPDLWANLCCSKLDQLKNLELVNIGQGGASNTEIFKNTVRAIANYGSDISVLFCQWTIVPRYNFNVGFELWSTSESLAGLRKRLHDINLNRGDHWDRDYVTDLLDRLLVLHHLHGEIINVVEYANILQKIAKKYNIKLYFINGLCPWDQDYFVRLSEETMPIQFTKFTKKEILNIESRDNDDILKLYKIMHDDYDQAGGIDTSCWVNLYSPMNKNKIDVNYDNHHPGIKSNQLYFQQIKDFLDN